MHPQETLSVELVREHETEVTSTGQLQMESGCHHFQQVSVH